MMERRATTPSLRVSRPEIARDVKDPKGLGISSGAMRRLFGDLKRHGFIKSVLGRNGGYWLTGSGALRARNMSK
jgi:DNA-binding IscR family transcriptional regulator